MKFIFCMQINIKIFYQLILSFVCGYPGMPKVPKISLYIFAVFLGTNGDAVDFFPQINTKLFYNLIVKLWLCIPRYVQITQNSKFVISLQYRKENVQDKVDFDCQYHYFTCVPPDMPKLPKIASL